MDIEEQFNRQQLLLAEQASGRIASFLDELTASLHYSARFLRTVGHDHPGRMTAIAGLYERLGGRLRVSEVGYIREANRPSVSATNEYADSLAQCLQEGEACLLVVREMGGDPAYLLGAAPVAEGDWLYAKVTIEDLDRSFVGPVHSGHKGRAWLLDGAGHVVVAPGASELVGRRLGDLAQELGDRRLADIAQKMMLGAQDFDWHSELHPRRRAWGHPRHLTAFSPLIPAITRFFDEVLVMDEDAKVRENRLGLLQKIGGMAKGVADLGKLEGF